MKYDAIDRKSVREVTYYYPSSGQVTVCHSQFSNPNRDIVP